MTDNKPKIKRDGDIPTIDAERIARAQKRLNSLHRRLGNWRAVGTRCGVNHKYAYDLALHAVVPSNVEVRLALFLPKVMPSERPAKRVREAMPKVWERVDLYLRKVKP